MRVVAGAPMSEVRQVFGLRVEPRLSFAATSSSSSLIAD